MYGPSKRIVFSRLPAVVLAAAVLAMPVQAADKRGGLGLGVGVNVGGIKAGVDARVGGSKGVVDADVGASVGGRNGLNADAKANVGGSRGLADVDVKAGLGGQDGVKARTTAKVGGESGLVDANVNAKVGGADGLGADVGATVGGRSLLDADVGVGLGDEDTVASPDRRVPRTPGDDDRHGDPADPADRDVLRAFSQLSGSERTQLVKRCRDIGSGGYDAALVKLCRLLETASR